MKNRQVGAEARLFWRGRASSLSQALGVFGRSWFESELQATPCSLFHSGGPWRPWPMRVTCQSNPGELTSFSPGGSLGMRDGERRSKHVVGPHDGVFAFDLVSERPGLQGGPVFRLQPHLRQVAQPRRPSSCGHAVTFDSQGGSSQPASRVRLARKPWPSPATAGRKREERSIVKSPPVGPRYLLFPLLGTSRDPQHALRPPVAGTQPCGPGTSSCRWGSAAVPGDSAGPPLGSIRSRSSRLPCNQASVIARSPATIRCHRAGTSRGCCTCASN